MTSVLSLLSSIIWFAGNSGEEKHNWTFMYMQAQFLCSSVWLVFRFSCTGAIYLRYTPLYLVTFYPRSTGEQQGTLTIVLGICNFWQTKSISGNIKTTATKLKNRSISLNFAAILKPLATASYVHAVAIIA